MAIRLGHIRWWQCLIVGVLVGVALWQTAGAIEGSRKPHVAVGMSLRRFVMNVTMSNVPSSTGRLTDLRVHPPVNGKNLVTGTEVGNGLPHAFEFVATVPFDTTIARSAATPYPSVREYLDKTAPALAYRYTWWEEPRWNAVIWAGGPVLVLGVLVPLMIALLRRLGVLPPLPVVVKEKRLPPSAPEPTKAAPPVDHAGISAQLRAATDDLEHRLTQAAYAEETHVGEKVAAVAAAPHVFTAGPADAPLPEVPKAATSFDGGVYYPVHRPKRGE
jgi:hypothetical protein